MESIWTHELVQQLSRLWDEGLSTAEIGRRLGVSKNAVVGKAHRLALTPRPSPLKRPPVRRAAPAVSAGAAAGSGTCSWPTGHPGEKDFSFCGKRTVAGKPYCAEHAAMAYVRPKSHNAA
jgi:GcrA cell cycle regulator